jgi:pyrimidine-specific ribonucleoside hydrolase
MDSHHKSHVVFEQFPIEPSLFRADLRPLVPEIIARHGREEWRICVLTNEIHHHLGIYSILGAKMGLKAREHLGASLGSLRVTSFAGSQPPVSCFNDGLQLSTGATLGHGNIELAATGPARVEADFWAGGEGVKMRLKAPFERSVQADVARAVEEHGNLTPAYFVCVRGLALRYWLQWSRHELFEWVALTLASSHPTTKS